MSKKKSNSSPTSRRKQYSAPALEKGLDILEILASEPDGLNISELAERQDRTVGQVFRMVAVLEQRKYIQLRGDSEAYILTLRMFELSHRYPPIVRIAAAAVPAMKSLSRQANQSCHLVIYYNGRGHVISQQDAPMERILTVRLGAEAALFDTCSGHVLLAFANDEDRAEMISKIPKGHRKPVGGEVTKLVARVRKQKNEIIDSAQVRGVQDIGYPVFDHSGTAVAALVVPFVSYLDDYHQTPIDEVVEFTSSAARAISIDLGFDETKGRG